ncbi:hypothetical protein VKT23_009535 [Stygiomarasmius scandens]|uniref:Uncharacterized protein n=1 Tax=Marasmiellus scandens TaxID=2682957 RepID=A0ABR1JEU6_9AGAR
MNQNSEDNQDVPSVSIEQPESVPFPSLSQTVQQLETSTAPQSTTSPDSNVSASSPLTSSDKLSALPQSMTTPNLNRGGRSPHSPRFRSSLDASKSWPNIPNMDAFGMSPSLNAASNAWSNTISGGRVRATASEGSLERETGRRSLDSDRGSLPTMHSVRNAFQRLHRGSDPASPPAHLRASDHHRDTPDAVSRSASQSRAASPLRILQQWSAGLHRTNTHHDETDPFIPVNPFQFNFRFRLPSFSFSKSTSPTTKESQEPIVVEELPVFHVTTDTTDTNLRESRGNFCYDSARRIEETKNYLSETLTTLFLAIYLHLLLRLPSMYFSRVSRIFEDAEVSKPDIQRMIDTCRGGSRFMAHGNTNTNANANTNNINTHHPNVNINSNRPNSRTDRPANSNLASSFTAANLAAAGISIASPFGGTQGQPQAHTHTQTHLSPAAAASVVDIDSVPMLPLPEEWTNQLVSPALMRFKLSWEAFVDSLMREWKTLNVVSALLLSAILTMFQVPDMATDPLTRTAALLSLICAIMSLSYGCMYIVRFGTMRSMYRASRWAEEAQKTKTLLWWNVWILLAMPAVWMSWSMIFFISSIISYVWRTGSILDPQEREGLSPRAVLGPRIAITGLFVLGMGYFVLIVKTLKAYGDDEKGRRVGAGGGGSGGAVHGRGTYPSHDHGTHRPGVEDINMNSIWERRGRERERSATSRRGRRSASLTRSPRRKSHDDHGQRMDFRERVNSLGQSQGHHHRKLFGLGFMGVGAGSGRVHDDGPGPSVSGVDGVDLEKGLPVETNVGM